MKTAIAVTTLMLAMPLAACSEDDPAVCGSVDDLKASVEDVKDIDVSDSSALTDLESALTAIGDDFAAVKDEASSEFSEPVDAVQTSFTELRASIEAAVADPTAATVAAAGEALSTFGTDVQTLIDDVQATC